jgi:hypothetical protein
MPLSGRRIFEKGLFRFDPHSSESFFKCLIVRNSIKDRGESINKTTFLNTDFALSFAFNPQITTFL